MEKILSFIRYLPHQIVGIVLIAILTLAGCLCLPFYRIPISRERERRLRIMIKACHWGHWLRGHIETLLGNRLLFFSRESDQDPYYLYLPKRALQRLPVELTRFGSTTKTLPPTRSVVVTLRLKKALGGGYLPARLVDYEVIDRRPDISK